MLWYGDSFSPKIVKYYSYKGEQFNKKKEKMRQLINSIKDTSLKEEDKFKLFEEIKNLIPTNK